MKISTNFYLRDKDSHNDTPIVLFLRYQKRRVKLATDLKIHPKYWNDKKQEAKKTYPYSTKFNTQLQDMVNALQEICIGEIALSNAEIKRQFNNKIKGIEEEEEQQKDFHEFVQEFIETAKTTRSAHTIKSYVTVYNRLLDFEKAKGVCISFEMIDVEFYEDLKDYFFTVRKHSNNTFGTTVKVLKAILNEATERDINTNIKFQKKRFKTVKEETDNIYLTEKELTGLYGFDFSDKPHLERVRDLFIVGCYTGLRFSDFTNIKPENIKGDFISIKTGKTGQDVVIPIHPMVQDVMKKYKGLYDNTLPPALHNQVMNRYLKEVGELAGLNEPCIIEKTKAGKKYSVTMKKYELIVTHTARRSFATNAYLAEIPTLAIMQITGHKTEKSFLKYIKVSQEENAQKLLSHPFFKRGYLKAV